MVWHKHFRTHSYAFVWVMMYKGGKARVLGLWLRLGTDAALFSAMLTYHIADGRYPNPGAKVSENHLFARYLVASILIFMLTLIIRDWWAIAVNVYKANRIRRPDNISAWIMAGGGGTLIGSIIIGVIQTVGKRGKIMLTLPTLVLALQTRCWTVCKRERTSKGRNGFGVRCN